MGSSTTIEALQVRWRKLAKQKKDGLVNLTTSHGVISFQLFYSAAPAACDNFVQLCERGYYNNVSFHRLIPGFMIQGGDPTGTGKGGATAWEGVHRFPDDPFERNPQTHASRGILSMANSGPNTNGSQFFITFKATPHLDRKHVVFGSIVSGHEVLTRMESEKVNEKDDVPVNTILIVSTEVKQKPTLKADQEDTTQEEAEVIIPVRPKMTSASVVGAFLKHKSGGKSGGSGSGGSGSGSSGAVKRKRATTGAAKSAKGGIGGGSKKKKFGGFAGW